MRPPRRLAMIVALALAITAIGAATGWLVLRRDPSVQVGSVPISGISVRAAPTTSATRSHQVEALDRLEGTFKAGDDPGQFTLGSVDLDFGPDAWVLTAGPLQDYDQDQRTEALLDELAGLTGQQVTTGTAWGRRRRGRGPHSTISIPRSSRPATLDDQQPDQHC